MVSFPGQLWSGSGEYHIDADLPCCRFNAAAPLCRLHLRGESNSKASSLLTRAFCFDNCYSNCYYS